MSDGERLLEQAAGAVEAARAAGAGEVEVFVHQRRSAEVEVQKDDVHNAATEEEATFGIRVIQDGAEGFATVNDPASLDQACAEALALASVSPSDPMNGLADPRPIESLQRTPDPDIAAMEIADLVDLAAGMIERVGAGDSRVRIDSGGVHAVIGTRAIATSTGIRAHESYARAGGSLFGMAVDGDDVGSFDYDGQTVLDASTLKAELDAAADRFVIKTTGALGARPGESFRGTIVLSPEVVASFVIGQLLAVLSGQAVRTGKSPLAEEMGKSIAAASLTVTDDARLPAGIASAAFDREGMPTQRYPILDKGVLKGFLYNVYEARAAGRESTGHASGGAASPPGIGTFNVIIEPGETSLSTLCSESKRCVLVSRFSDSSNPITGEFSGVVKGGFLVSNGERTPINETMIAGNLYDLLKSISGVSSEVRFIDGHLSVPALRVEDVSITAG